MTSCTSRWALGAAGVAAMIWAGWLALTGGSATNPIGIATWLVGALVLHDTVFAPVCVGIGWLIARVLPPWLRAPVQVGAFVAGVVTIASAPLLLGLGRRSDNPSADPLDYPHNLLVVAAVIAATCATWAVAAWRRQQVQVDETTSLRNRRSR